MASRPSPTALFHIMPWQNFYFSFFIFPHDTQWCRFFIFYFSLWYTMVHNLYSFIFCFSSWYSTCWVSPGKKKKESGGIFRIWLHNKGRHFWIMNEIERVGQWMNEWIQGSWANMGKKETDGMDSRSWNGHSWKNGNGWNIGRLDNLGKLDTDDEHGKVGQFKEVVWRVYGSSLGQLAKGWTLGKVGQWMNLEVMDEN